MLKIKTRIFSLLPTIFLLVFTVSCVSAAPPLSIHIEVDEWISIGGVEPFVASGLAVDDGLVCATGTVEDLSITSTDIPFIPYTIVWAHKYFECDDMSGTFDIKMVVKLDNATHFTTARWRVVGGTGNYADLRGTGSLVGTPIVPGESITDIYDGQMH